MNYTCCYLAKPLHCCLLKITSFQEKVDNRKYDVSFAHDASDHRKNELIPFLVPYKKENTL